LQIEGSRKFRPAGLGTGQKYLENVCIKWKTGDFGQYGEY